MCVVFWLPGFCIDCGGVSLPQWLISHVKAVSLISETIPHFNYSFDKAPERHLFRSHFAVQNMICRNVTVYSTSVFSCNPGSSKLLFGKQCQCTQRTFMKGLLCATTVGHSPEVDVTDGCFFPDPRESEKQSQLSYLYSHGITVKITHIYKTHTRGLEMTKPSKHCDIASRVLGAFSVGYRSCKRILRGKPPSKALFHI